MSTYASYNPERAKELTDMLDELVDLLENYYYDNNIRPILIQETKIYEFASDYLPTFVPDLDRFFHMIHQSLRYGIPPESADVDAHISSIQAHIRRMQGYADLYRLYSDEYSRHSRETSITSYHDRNSSQIERDVWGAVSLPELTNNDEDYEEATEIIRSAVLERFAERKRQRISGVLAYLERQEQPCSMSEIQASVPNASWPVIRLLLKQKKIIRYTGDRFFLVSKLKINNSEKADLIEAVEDCFILDRILNCHEIYHKIASKFENLFQRLHIETANNMLTVFSVILPDAFEYKQPKIALAGVSIPEPMDNIVRFLKNKFQTRVVDLKEYIDTMEYEIPINMNTLTSFPGIYLSNHDTLIPASRVNLTEEQKQEIIELIMRELEEREEDDGEALAIRNLRCLVDFPVIDLPWDEWLVYCLIKDFQTSELHVSFTTSRYSVAIPIISLNEKVSSETRRMIMEELKGKEYDSSKLKLITSDNFDELFDEELEDEWLMEDLDNMEDDFSDELDENEDFN